MARDTNTAQWPNYNLCCIHEAVKKCETDSVRYRLALDNPGREHIFPAKNTCGGGAMALTRTDLRDYICHNGECGKMGTYGEWPDDRYSQKVYKCVMCGEMIAETLLERRLRTKD